MLSQLITSTLWRGLPKCSFLDLIFLPLMAHHNIDIFQTLELQPIEISVLSKAMDSDLYCKQGTAARFCCSLITASGLSFLSSLLDEQSVTN